MLDSIDFGPTPAGTFCAYESRLLLNPEHPAVRRLLSGSSIEAEPLYYLVSGLYSVLNRALPEIEDRHEREFHRQILRTLAG
ncbi:MAG: hypothetical protein HY319_31825 [Armatimonadetes bacterium]|nr:hypothetical protein [Armatimonadota bacterium]